MTKPQGFATRLRAARAMPDAERFELLESYRNYLKLLANIGADEHLRAKVGDSDIVQETLMQAHRDFDQFRGSTEKELTGWMRSIMSMKKAVWARKFYGTAARDPRLEQQLNHDLDQSSQLLEGALVADGTSPSQAVVRRELAVVLADALAAMPAHYREVVVLHHVKGCTLPQVAESMGRSTESVKKLWARAIVRLRFAMKDEIDD